MTARLCYVIPDSFANAQDVDIFFDHREINIIRRTHEVREQPQLGVPGASCKTNLFFGFFFDGTKNNYKLAQATKNHSNVARLYDCYPGLSVPGVLPSETDWQYQRELYKHFFKVYVPGVASPFPDVKDSGKDRDLTLGAATGWGGEPRITWALIQAINNVHRYFYQQPLIASSEVPALLRSIKLNRHQRQNMEGFTPATFDNAQEEQQYKTRQVFETLLRRLHKAVSQHWSDPKTGRPAKIDPGIVQTIFISTFGFSRGATQARAFANWLISLCKLDASLCGKSGTRGMTLGGFDVEFDFLGLFDTVASVGLGNTLGNSWVGRFFDGHGAWADAEDSLRIPSEITQCLHLVAGHEVRRSFPLDSISVGSSLPSNCEEIVVPGVHSDLGGGYCPKEQGKGTDPEGADMLSRIPLIYMYRAARLAGAPLKLELATKLPRQRFEVAPATITALNAYLGTCNTTTGSLTAIMREQRRRYIEWRLMRRVSGSLPLERTTSFLQASSFDRSDLESANKEFEQEIQTFEQWLSEKKRGRSFVPKQQAPGFDNDYKNEWQEIGTWWKSTSALSTEAAGFFDDYVHDSRAWFKLIPGNPDSEEDMHKLLQEWVKKRREALRRSQSAANSPETAVSVDDGLTLEQRRAADAYAQTGEIPQMLTTGREPFDGGSSNYFLSAKAGYLRFRKVYGGADSVLISNAPHKDEKVAVNDTAKASA